MIEQLLHDINPRVHPVTHELLNLMVNRLTDDTQTADQRAEGLATDVARAILQLESRLNQTRLRHGAYTFTAPGPSLGVAPKPASL